MMRDDALKKLEGTWCFEMRDGKVLVRDAALLETAKRLQARDPRPPFRRHGRPATPGLRSGT